MFYTVFREVLPGGHCRVLSKRVPQRLISGILGVCFPVGSLSLWLLPLLPDPFISVAFWPLISPASWPLHLSLFLTPALLPAAHECCLVLLCSLLYFTHTHWVDMGGRHHWSKESDFPTLVDRTMQLREKQQPMKSRAQERRRECGESIFTVILVQRVDWWWFRDWVMSGRCWFAWAERDASQREKVASASCGAWEQKRRSLDYVKWVVGSIWMGHHMELSFITLYWSSETMWHAGIS